MIEHDRITVTLELHDKASGLRKSTQYNLETAMHYRYGGEATFHLLQMQYAYIDFENAVEQWQKDNHYKHEDEMP